MIKAFILIIFSLLVSGCTIPSSENEQSGVQINTVPVSASVFINDEYVNTTPFLDTQLKPGFYRVRLEPLDSKLVPYEMNLKVSPQTFSGIFWTFAESVESSSGLKLELEPLADQKKSELSVVSIPDNVIFSIDDTPGQLTPLMLDTLTPKEYQFKSVAASYLPLSSSFKLTKGFRTNLWVKLGRDPQHFANLQEEAEQFASATVGASIQDSDQATLSAEIKTQTLTIGNTPTGWLRVRARPSTSAPETARVTAGETYSYLQEENGWYEIEYEQGKRGWVSSQYVLISPEDEELLPN